MKNLFRALALVAATSCLSGCLVGPNYERPDTNLPSVFRGGDSNTASMGDLKWMQVMRDPVLQGLITEAVTNNFDVKVAVARVLEARASLAATKGAQMPTLIAQGNAQYVREPGVGSNNTFTAWQKSLGAQLSYETDLWGQLARNTQSAQAQYIATQDAQQAVLTTVVSSVANGYLALRELDLELQISQQTLAARQASLDLVSKRLRYGVATKQDVLQAQSLVDTVNSEIPNIQREITATENAISILLGRNPGPIARGLPLTEQFNLPSPPAGVPGQLLERRPDVRQAEQLVVAANAQIGAQMATLLPNLFITGNAATVNSQLSGIPIVGSNAATFGVFSLAAALSQVLFDGGQRKARVALARAQTQEAVATYQFTVTESVREVSDALNDYHQYVATVAEQQRLANALHESVRLAYMRYNNGVTTYLEVLNAQQQAYAADLSLAQAEFAQRSSLISLYKALGGGWQ